LCNAIILLKHYRSPDCLICIKLQLLLADENVRKYLRSDEFRDGRVPVQTAMCDNFQGWGNFSRNVFGIDSNVCKPHAIGKFFIHCSVVTSC
jgi:hypothetical protein